MGMNVDATLVYGYDLGSMDDFKATERGEYGSPVLPWLSDDEDAEDEQGFADAAETVLLASVGFDEEWTEDSDGFYARQRAAQERLGVDFEYSGSHDFAGYILHAVGSKRTASWAETITLDPAEIALPRPDWDAKLTAALTALGITPTQTGPRWLVFPFYG